MDKVCFFTQVDAQFDFLSQDQSSVFNSSTEFQFDLFKVKNSNQSDSEHSWLSTQYSTEFDDSHCASPSQMTHYQLLSNEEMMADIRLFNVLCKQDWRKISRKFEAKYNVNVSRLEMRKALKFEKDFNALPKATFTQEVDDLILHGVEVYGKNWIAISNSFLPGRCPNSLKNRYYTLMKKTNKKGVQSKKFAPKREQMEEATVENGCLNYGLDTLVKDIEFECAPAWLKFIESLQ